MSYELLQEQEKIGRKELDTQNRVYSISREYAERFRELDRIRDEIKKLEAQKQQWEVQEEKIGWGQKSLAVAGTRSKHRAYGFPRAADSRIRGQGVDESDVSRVGPGPHLYPGPQGQLSRIRAYLDRLLRRRL